MAEKKPCPRCDSANTVLIINGYPTQEAEEMVQRGEAVHGGCIGNPAERPNRFCRACKYEWREDSGE